MAQTQITKVDLKHEAIMNYMIANPLAKKGEIAIEFGVSSSWLSIIINSDCFQAMIREKQDLIFQGFAKPLEEKLTNVAHLAVDKLADKIAVVEDVEQLSNIANNALEKLGYGVDTGGKGSGDVFLVDKMILAQGREAMGEVSGVQTSEERATSVVIEGTADVCEKEAEGERES